MERIYVCYLANVLQMSSLTPEIYGDQSCCAFITRTLSAELVTRGVRVNVISPGLTETPIYGKLGLPAEAVNEWAKQLMAKVLVSRFGQAEEVAKAVLFLASEDSSYMVGENVLFDGGLATI